jgi:hypothetical protein
MLVERKFSLVSGLWRYIWRELNVRSPNVLYRICNAQGFQKKGCNLSLCLRSALPVVSGGFSGVLYLQALETFDSHTTTTSNIVLLDDSLRRDKFRVVFYTFVNTYWTDLAAAACSCKDGACCVEGTGRVASNQRSALTSSMTPHAT